MTRDAISLMLEDELRKVIDRDRRFKHREKLSGLVPPDSTHLLGISLLKEKRVRRRTFLLSSNLGPSIHNHALVRPLAQVRSKDDQ